MKVGLVQLAPVLGNPQATLAAIDRLLAGVALPELLVLPELCNSGYNFTSMQQARDLAEPIGDSAFLDHLQRICSRGGCRIVCGFNELADNQLYNTAVLLGPDGVIGKYRKLHLFLNEKDYFQPGDLGLPVFDLGCCRVGLLICFDWFFPEVWRILALKGADIICHPANLVLPGLAQRGVEVHAMTNRVFVILANRTGREGDLAFTGLSRIVDPRGDVLASAAAQQEQVLIADIDVGKARAKHITPRNHVLDDRRPAEYRLLAELHEQKKAE
jgi:predicted amidohydrolase